MTKTIILCIIAVCLGNTSLAQAAALLERVTRLGSGNTAQLFFTFDSLPEYEQTSAGKRLNIIFKNTSPASDIALPAPDDEIIKLLLDEHHDDTVLSLFLRYPPQRVRIDSTADDRLVLEVALGDEYSASYRDFSEKVSGVSVVQRQVKDYANPLLISPYVGDWQTFIPTYDPDVSLDFELHFTLPPFPVLALFPEKQRQVLASLPGEIMRLAEQQLWADLHAMLHDMLFPPPVPEEGDQARPPLDPEVKKALALTFGESLLRDGQFTDGYKQLYLLAETYPNEHLGLWARYLTLVATAQYDSPHLARLHASSLTERMPPLSTLASYLHMLQIEIALATKDPQLAEQLLKAYDIAYPDTLYKTRILRQADLAVLQRNLVAAYALYESVDANILAHHPGSLSNSCETLYSFKRLAEAADCYGQIQEFTVHQPATHGLAAYRQAMARYLQTPDSGEHLDIFEEIAANHPDTEAGFRAALKANDLRVLADSSWAEQAIPIYQALGDNASWRAVAEEAYFKQALLYFFVGQRNASITVLSRIIRNARSGSLATTAEALLLSILPDEIRELIANQQYLKALALAKQHRRYFERQWLDWRIFNDIALAYKESGLNSEAVKAYLYLYDIAPADERERYFLPMVEALFQQGSYAMVVDYSSQYEYLYPQGADLRDIRQLRLKALAMLGRYQEASALLPPVLPEDGTDKRLAATIYFYSDEPAKTVEILAGLEPETVTGTDRYLLAESYFLTGKYPEADRLYEQLSADDTRALQALYRRGQIAREQGDLEKSLNFYRQIVEKGKDSSWGKFAEKELEYLQIETQARKLLDESYGTDTNS